MQQQLLRLHRWHQTRPGLLAFGLAESAVAALFMSRAFETGSLFEYFVAFVSLAGALQNFVRLARTFIGGPKRAD